MEVMFANVALDSYDTDGTTRRLPSFAYVTVTSAGDFPKSPTTSEPTGADVQRCTQDIRRNQREHKVTEYGLA